MTVGANPVEQERVAVLSDCAVNRDGRYVLYWMQQSQRADNNPALEYAVAQADELHLPLVTCFGLAPSYPDANLRHYAFMLEGLRETHASLSRRGIPLIARFGSPPEIAGELGVDAALIVCDRGYLRHQREWRAQLAAECGRRLVEIDGDVVVPVETASQKREYAARTIRPRIHRQRDRFITDLSGARSHRSGASPVVPDPSQSRHRPIDLTDPASTLATLDVDTSVGASTRFHGGTAAARKRLEQFIERNLDGYATARNDPGDPAETGLSPYLHFGQISPREIALRIVGADTGSPEDKEAFLEQLVVRRELSVNFVWFEDRYDGYDCLPEWARRTLSRHRADKRPFLYTEDELVRCATHDEMWNAAMREMVATGFMHNYMRMYWGKKILEWSASPEDAYATLLTLNNRYFLDGRDPNSYASVGWIFGLHDRPWKERPVFGTVRYMSEDGLRRKFDTSGYVERVARLAAT